MRKYLKETIKHLLRSYPFIRKYVKEFEEYSQMTSEELQERNNKRFLEILHRAYNKSPFYKKFYDDAGVDIKNIRGIEDIDKLPVLTKDMVRAHTDEILTVPKWLCVKGYTSGTMGTPLKFYSSWKSIWKTRACIYYYRKECGFTYGKDVLVSLRGNLNAHETKLWVGLSKTLFLSSYRLNFDNTQEYYDAITVKKPKAIEGYPSSLYAFACNLEEKGLVCNIPLCFTSSENLLDYERIKIEKMLNTQIYDWYGVSENTIILAENKSHDGYYEIPGYSINEYLRDYVLTTSIVNKDFPIIRYRVDDTINYKDGRVIGVDGRTNLYLLGLDGTKYSDAGLTLIPKEILSIKYAQFVQLGNGKVDLNIVLYQNTTITESNMNKLYKMIDDKIGLNNIDLSINIIDESQIIYSKRGKFNMIVNHKLLSPRKTTRQPDKIYD